MCFGGSSKSSSSTPPSAPRPRATKVVKATSIDLRVQKFPLNMAYVGNPDDVDDVLLSIYGSQSAYELEIAQDTYILRARRSLTPDEVERIKDLEDHYLPDTARDLKKRKVRDGCRE